MESTPTTPLPPVDHREMARRRALAGWALVHRHLNFVTFRIYSCLTLLEGAALREAQFTRGKYGFWGVLPGGEVGERSENAPLEALMGVPFLPPNFDEYGRDLLTFMFMKRREYQARWVNETERLRDAIEISKK